MELSKNIIKKLTVEVDTSSMAFGLQIKNDIDGFLKQYIYPRIEKYLDQKIPENELWRFEKINLEIDLDSSESFKEVQTQIISKLERKFEEQTTDNSQKEIREITPRSAPKSRVNAFIEFLRTGQYPWWFETENSVTITDFLTIKNKLIKEQIISEIYKTNSFNRLIYQFDNQFITKIYYWHHFEEKIAALPEEIIIPTILKAKHKSKFWFAMLSHHKPKIISFFKEIIIQLSTKKKGSDNEYYQLSNKASENLTELIEFCNKILKIGVALSPSQTSQKALKIVLTSDYKKAISVNKKVLQNSTKKKQKEPGLKVLDFIISEDEIDFKNDLNPTTDSVEKLKSKTPPTERSKQVEIPKKKEQKNLVENEAKEEFGKAVKDTIDEEMKIDGTLIEKAGLVLLHPFLKHFFINMELVSENKVRPEKQDLAVHLLHYIATKSVQPSEHELVFEKYLCHVPVNQPIDRFVELTSEQKNACDELLQAVLKHWSALRTNSIDALRSEFLLRQGKLTINDERHRLFVQRNTQDILLDTLPWNLHLVKLPWKKQLLYVEW
ncbi:MAG: contractile injection system tape measure protein [Bacteroidota bacterium]